MIVSWLSIEISTQYLSLLLLSLLEKDEEMIIHFLVLPLITGRTGKKRPSQKDVNRAVQSFFSIKLKVLVAKLFTAKG
jgi:hypothetical protein